MARYLSRADLSRTAGKYIDQYYTRFGISKDDPSPINLEQFASSVLGLNVKMLPLCSDGSILGVVGATAHVGTGVDMRATLANQNVAWILLRSKMLP